MSTALAHPGTEAIPFTRLLDVESRKLVDTRSGFWLVAGIGAAMVAVGALFAAFGGSLPADWAGASQMVMYPIMLLLPVLAVLTMTSEWSTRSALVTFTLEPRRGRVLAAKAVVLVGAVAVGLAASLAIGAVTVLAQNALHGSPLGWELPLSGLVGMFAMLTASTLFGAALGAVTHNAPASIVTIFALPMLFGAVASLSETGAKVLTWIDYNQTLTFLFGGWGGGLDWAKAVSSLLVMIVLPAALGLWRSLAREAS